jgi:glutathione peroxidase-family protein
MAEQGTSAWDFSFPAIDGGAIDLAAFKGRVLVVANTASFCGYTYQYEGLQKLHEAEAGRGVAVIGVPSRDFNQESPDNATVKAFCTTKYGIGFPLTGAVLCLGARGDGLGAELELQQGADRPGRTDCRHVRLRRRTAGCEAQARDRGRAVIVQACRCEERSDAAISFGTVPRRSARSITKGASALRLSQ